jgi:hypothetical protein
MLRKLVVLLVALLCGFAHGSALRPLSRALKPQVRGLSTNQKGGYGQWFNKYGRGLPDETELSKGKFGQYAMYATAAVMAATFLRSQLAEDDEQREQIRKNFTNLGVWGSAKVFWPHAKTETKTDTAVDEAVGGNKFAKLDINPSGGVRVVEESFQVGFNFTAFSIGLQTQITLLPPLTFHSSVGRALDCRSSGPWFDSG